MECKVLYFNIYDQRLGTIKMEETLNEYLKDGWHIASTTCHEYYIYVFLQRKL